MPNSYAFCLFFIVSTISSYSYDALLHAAIANDHELVRVILDSKSIEGCSDILHDFFVGVGKQCLFSPTAIQDLQWQPILHQLIDYGLPYNTYDAHGRTLLHKAVKYGLTYFLETMIGLGLEVNDQDNDGNAPMHLLALYDRGVRWYATQFETIVFILVKHGADVAIKNKDGAIPYKVIDSFFHHRFLTTVNIATACIRQTRGRVNKSARKKIV